MATGVRSQLPVELPTGTPIASPGGGAYGGQVGYSHAGIMGGASRAPQHHNQQHHQQQRDFSNERAGGLRFAQQVDKEEEKAPPPVDIVPWRMRERMKTMDVALVLCLNIGTDPPDVVKASPCARKECWVDPFSMPAQKALETIGKTLQSQYERWQARARYRQSLDPTVEETKQLCVSMRRHAKNDRVLFHYNGHGVPRPTPNGEIWVFNKSYTQYIPLLVYDLQSWVGTPSIYVFDCSAAGILLSHFNSNNSAQPGADASPSSSAGEAIVLAACAANEILPMNPELCADVFTSCLTTPITVALRWFISQSELSMSHLDASFIDRIPGKLTDRKTPLGELNWIFTAITDTIAWNVLPKELFQKLFRQDLLVASLFRNFLLAERIMKSAGCSPCSLPSLPSTHHHPLWRSWDLAAEICLNQLYKISNPHPQAEVSIQPSRFFAEQLTAFEVWLQFGASTKPPPQQLPMVLQVLLSQVHRLRALVLLKKFLDLGPWAVNLALSVGIFPYVLKLLQSPAAELRQVLVFIWTKILALDPSCQVDLVKDDGHSYFISHLAASLQNHGAGHVPYGHVGGHHHGQPPPNVIPSDQKVMSAFILSVICDNCPQGQRSCLSQYLHKICSNMLVDANEDVRMWVCLCLAKLWENFEDGKRVAIDDQVPRILSLRLSDERPEVRAAAAYSFGSLLGLQVDATLIGKIGDAYHIEDYIHRRGHDDILIAMGLLRGCQDASPLVRRESVLALANVILHTYHQPRFELVAKHFKNRSLSKRAHGPQAATTSAPVPVSNQDHSTSSSSSGGDRMDHHHDAHSGSEYHSERRLSLDVQVDPELVEAIGEDTKFYCQIWQALKEIQSRDPFPKVVNAAKSIVSHVNASILAAEQDALRRTSLTTATGASSGSNGSNARLDAPPRSGSGLPGIQREGSVPDLPAIAQMQSRGLLGANSERAGMLSAGGQLQEQPGLRRTSELMPTASGGGIRPTQSVGNFRLYQEEHRSSNPSMGPGNLGGGGLSSNNQTSGGSMFGNLAQARHYGSSTDSSSAAQGQPGGLSRQVDANAMRAPGGVTSPSLDFYHPGFQYGRDVNFPPRLRSKLYERHRAQFNEAIMEPMNEDDDPLSEKGAERLERKRRFDRIRKGALKIAPGFSIPDNSQQQQQQLSQSLGVGSYSSARSVSPTSYMASPGGMPPAGPYSSSSYGGGAAAPRPSGDREEVKNFSLNLRQRAVLNCDAEMTSLLLFHPYETMLIVADDKDQLSLYNFEQSEKKVMSFGNKNPTGYVCLFVGICENCNEWC